MKEFKKKKISIALNGWGNLLAQFHKLKINIVTEVI